MDAIVQRIQSRFPGVAFTKRSSSEYDVQGRVVRLEATIGSSGTLEILVVDGPLRQPLADYVAGQARNEAWPQVPAVQSALHALPERRRVSFEEVFPETRAQAMEVAVMEAEAREQHAQEQLSKHPGGSDSKTRGLSPAPAQGLAAPVGLALPPGSLTPPASMAPLVAPPLLSVTPAAAAAAAAAAALRSTSPQPLPRPAGWLVPPAAHAHATPSPGRAGHIMGNCGTSSPLPPRAFHQPSALSPASSTRGSFERAASSRARAASGSVRFKVIPPSFGSERRSLTPPRRGGATPVTPAPVQLEGTPSSSVRLLSHGPTQAFSGYASVRSPLPPRTPTSTSRALLPLGAATVQYPASPAVRSHDVRQPSPGPHAARISCDGVSQVPDTSSLHTFRRTPSTLARKVDVCSDSLNIGGVDNASMVCLEQQQPLHWRPPPQRCPPSPVHLVSSASTSVLGTPMLESYDRVHAALHSSVARLEAIAINGHDPDHPHGTAVPHGTSPHAAAAREPTAVAVLAPSSPCAEPAAAAHPAADAAAWPCLRFPPPRALKLCAPGRSPSLGDVCAGAGPPSAPPLPRCPTGGTASRGGGSLKFPIAGRHPGAARPVVLPATSPVPLSGFATTPSPRVRLGRGVTTPLSSTVVSVLGRSTSLQDFPAGTGKEGSARSSAEEACTRSAAEEGTRPADAGGDDAAAPWMPPPSPLGAISPGSDWWRRPTARPWDKVPQVSLHEWSRERSPAPRTPPATAPCLASQMAGSIVAFAPPKRSPEQREQTDTKLETRVATLQKSFNILQGEVQGLYSQLESVQEIVPASEKGQDGQVASLVARTATVRRLLDNAQLETNRQASLIKELEASLGPCDDAQGCETRACVQ